MNRLQTIVRSVQKTRKVALPLTKCINDSQRVITRQYADNPAWKQQDNQSTSNNTPSNLNTEAEEKQYEQDIKNKILEEALRFAQDTGFTLNSITAAGQACGYPGVVHGLFPQGGADLIHYFNMRCNEQLVEQMKIWQKEAPPADASKPPVEFIKKAVMTRLLMLDPYKKHWARAMALQTLPNNVPNSLATLLSLVDDICYYSGDRSVDFNWYIRRVGLAGIYKASELYFLSDNSEDHVATSNFVHTRIKDAELIQSALNTSPVAAAPQALSAAFITAKNMLGINSLK